ncbi:P-loop containing nucleoside triphosphate hydrolase protein [Achaetomium macrosporum]|uniref:ATP-dependent RNA helicase n=1 Tax=Achaetomium macrosporum TaxID=79813 RepID=A0AAN7HEN3_9PEZI|nr:P-loop containing nucleoside triphosphate hydrolase protein [Achaetomium macrosporum]
MALDKKRKRSEGYGKRGKASAVRSKRQKISAMKRVASVDSLAWKQVEIPEMFDDAEGFYGLEEVEGVDVVREGNTVKFVAATAESDSSEDSEFEGFDDAAAEGAEPPSAPAGPAAPAISGKEPEASGPSSEGRREKGKRDKQKVPATAQAAKGDPELETNVFAQATDIAEADAEKDDVAMSEWVPIGLSSQMLTALARLKFTKPTAIQSQAIPHVLNGHDLIGKAATGSGKTLAFGIPIVENWLATTQPAGDRATSKRQPIALVLSPTRELAHQITDHLKQLCAGLSTSPYICSVTGGLAVQKQQRQLEKADIVIGTPGRMWEVMSTSNSVLSALRGIRFLVVDEADRLLQDGHFKEAEEILKALDRSAPGDEKNDDSSDNSSDQATAPGHHRQTLVFSATFNKALQQKLAGKARYNLMGEAESLEYLLKRLNFREAQPKFLDANPVSQMAENLKEGLIQCGDLEKDLYLYAVLLLQPTRRALVFTNSINTVRRLTPFLQNLNLPAFALHSDMEQKARLRSIERFKADNPDKQASSVLIATDVAARGLDIPSIDLVIHYHVPRSADDYVHRSGRTARAANSGVSILLCGPKEAVPTQRLIAKVHAAAAANTSRSKLTSSGVGVQTIDIDRRLVSHLRPRVVLSKKITETTLAKEKGAKEDTWMKQAAKELGVEYDPDELEHVGSWKGRGSGKKQREKEARAVTKDEVKQWRWELKELLSRRVNNGVSEKYLAGVDVDGLLSGARGSFLGVVEGLGL